jgi:hypothetical protein
MPCSDSFVFVHGVTGLTSGWASPVTFHFKFFSMLYLRSKFTNGSVIIPAMHRKHNFPLELVWRLTLIFPIVKNCKPSGRSQCGSLILIQCFTAYLLYSGCAERRTRFSMVNLWSNCQAGLSMMMSQHFHLRHVHSFSLERALTIPFHLSYRSEASMTSFRIEYDCLFTNFFYEPNMIYWMYRRNWYSIASWEKELCSKYVLIFSTMGSTSSRLHQNYAHVLIMLWVEISSLGNKH